MTTSRPAPRIAIGGFMLESNSHAPVATRAEFEANVLLAGDALAADLDAPAPRSPGTITGFVRAMDAGGPWTRLPTILAAVGASGSCEQGGSGLHRFGLRLPGMASRILVPAASPEQAVHARLAHRSRVRRGAASP